MGRLIGIDIDGVLSDIAAHLVEFADTMFGYRLSLEDLTSENVETCSPLTSDQLKDIFSSSSFFQTLPAFKAASKSLNLLRECGLGVVLITDRFWYPEIQVDTLQWLQKNKLPFDRLYFVPKAKKAEFASKLDIKLFIEDQLSNANTLARVCDTVFLINRSYNQGRTEQSVTRVSSLEEAVSTLSASHTKSVSRRSGLEV
jgi:uncharacterized HAD superfamily protein